MNEKCFTRNPLVRDGVSQPQRVLATLLPAYVAVDERSMKDLAEFAYKFASELRYFDQTDTIAGTWKEFFEITTNWDAFSLEDFLAELKIDQQTKPHLALFFGFLYMYKVAQDDMNTITERHLDFYYREVLQLKENSGIPDQVAVIFNLAKHVDSYLVKKGTVLKAGKDDIGVERWYKVQKDVAVNKAVVKELKALFVDKNVTPTSNGDHSVYASPIANSSDGNGAKIENEEQSWETFGRAKLVDDRTFGALGFAIASPLLFLEEGERIVTIEFSFSKKVFDDDLDPNLFKVQFSGEEEWIIPEAVASDITRLRNVPTNKLIIKRTLSLDQLSVVKYNAEHLLNPFETEWPVLKIALNQEYSKKSGPNPKIYKKLKGLQATQVKLIVEVNGMRNLILQNDQAVLDASKPFQPFGNKPQKGSNFYIGSWEVFQKKLTSLSLGVKWKDLPESNFATHYADYGYSAVPNNTSFQFQPFIMEKKVWEPVTLGQLFTDENGNNWPASDPLPGPTTQPGLINIGGVDDTKFKRNPSLELFEDYNTSTKKGFLRLSLRTADFGHPVFPKAFSKQSILLATWNGTNTPYPEPQLPNDPYTPTIETLSLNYKTEVTIPIAGVKPSTFEKSVEQYFYVHPFGANLLDRTFEYTPIPSGTKNNYFLPQYNSEGNLYIGIENLKPPQTLSILFQHAEGSANPDANKQDVKWSYLKDNVWVDLDPNKHILADGTDGLLNTGIIWFDIPELITNTNTLLPSGQYWLRASVENEADAVCDLIDVRAQAVLAAFDDNDNDPDHLRNALEAGTIKKLLVSNSSIDKIEQPYASFDGQIKEQKPEFYTRISERLRHKHRAITIWDYEHLILQKYPDVYKVKCINHTKYTGDLNDYAEMAPGHVTLIVISNVFNKNAVDPLRPKTSLSRLSDIDEYIKTINPPCAEIHVKNPIYEEIKVDFEVKFHRGVDIGLHTQKLNKEIKDFLSPWASDCPKEVRFGGRIHKSMILNFVEERSYVDYVTCFKMYHIIPNDPTHDATIDVDEVTASRAITILGSHDEHVVTFIPTDQEDCVCDDNVIPTTEQMLSIDNCTRYLDPEDIPDKDLINDLSKP